MSYTRLGRSGLKVSRIALGMMSYGELTTQQWALDEDEAEPIVRCAVEACRANTRIAVIRNRERLKFQEKSTHSDCAAL
jgi:hypothetical protein